MLRVLACAGLLLGAAALHAADDDGNKNAAPVSRFFDPDDGWLDVSGFLDTAYGFVPIVAPITENGTRDAFGGHLGNWLDGGRSSAWLTRM